MLDGGLRLKTDRSEAGPSSQLAGADVVIDETEEDPEVAFLKSLTKKQKKKLLKYVKAQTSRT